VALVVLVVIGLGVAAALSGGGGGGDPSAGSGPRARAPAAPATPRPGRNASAVAPSAPPPTVPVPARSGRLTSLPVGSGVRGAEVVRPAGRSGRLPTILFLHGWGLVARSDYRAWIRHLARAGNEVIVPRYQLDKHSVPARAFPDALAGIRAALRRFPPVPGTLVAAGHSAGGALAADYAASAASLGLPRPLAVFSVYPGRRILGYPGGVPEVDPARIGPRTRIVALAGAADVVVGTLPAQMLVRDAVRVPRARRRYLLVRDPAVDDHYGPTRPGPHARRAFWSRLDRLARLARRPA